MFGRIRDLILGKPLATKAIRHERLSNAQGLAIFSSDSLSSTAYATEEILLVLATVGIGVFFYSIPITIAISILIILVSVSYRQVIHAYPQGGGVYNVARHNLGEFPSLVGAASLLIDYVLTAAVSVAAGVAAITSAFPVLFPHRVSICVGAIVFLTWANLRGVRESGRLFAVPPYAFIAIFLGMIGYGIFKFFTGGLPVSSAPAPAVDPSFSIGAVGIFLLLRAFASGCAAMTGIEATSNGVQAFKPPESQNAAKTLLRMAVVLAVIFSGITLLAYWGRIVPRHEETVVSQITQMLFGRTPLYFLVQAATAMILILAANTPFAGFPRVASQLAKDGYFPRQFFNLGSRLVFANGIVALAGFACLLIWLFQGNVHALIPIYAVGVFLGFSLSQLGMVKHWMKLKRVRINIAVNLVGCVATSIVFGVVLVSKFFQGAWILLPIIFLLIAAMKKVKSHYNSMEQALALDAAPLPEICARKTMIILVSDLNRITLHAVRFAKSFRPASLRAVHVAVDGQAARALKKKWIASVPDVPIDTLISEYRDLINPILEYLKKIGKELEKEELIVVMPELVPKKIWHHFLHNQTALRIRFAIEQDPEINAEI
ncbi:MAG: APC family permease, partial [bacterium]|nr:APC family permease [bacterium]